MRLALRAVRLRVKMLPPSRTLLAGAMGTVGGKAAHGVVNDFGRTGKLGALGSGEVGVDPLKNWGEPELTLGDRRHYEFVSRASVYFQIKSVDEEKRVCGREGYAVIAIKEWVVVGKRFHEGGDFLRGPRVVTRLRTKNCRLQQAVVSDSV
ncbi:MAG TPA: hypothetical protein VGR97_06600 [Candidatus Acidoferrales bacterium]|nr:hypothetical protein [Candidatus Acidoferrales bacterium]